jgi:hypothetical protein
MPFPKEAAKVPDLKDATMKKLLLVLLLSLTAIYSFPPMSHESRAEAADEKPAKVLASYDPTFWYVEQQIEGWRVLVNQRLLIKENQEVREQTVKLLGDHLFRVTRVVPADALAKLRKIPIWVELAHPRHPCMCYHPSAQWLREHQMNPEKARGVEIANVRNFLRWTTAQPWMVLHELAHGYHDQVLGFDHSEVKACYEAAKTSKMYDSVLHINGKKQRHYAMNNPMEYFAESSEAFFGTNDFFPFVRAELQQHDPRMFALLEKLWGVRPAAKE